MAKKKPDLEKMKLTSAVKKYLEMQEWTDEIEVDDDGDSVVKSGFNINGQSYRFYIEGWEAQERLKVFMYSPFNVPLARMNEMAVIMNWVNWRIAIGRFAFKRQDEPSPVQYYGMVDVEGGTLSPEMVQQLVGGAVELFEAYGDIMTTVALTKTSAETAIADFEEARRKAEAENEAPDEL